MTAHGTGAPTTTTDWWHQASAAALLGTTRRPPPGLPPSLGLARRGETDPEVALLDAAAVGGTLRRAGRHAGTAGSAVPAPPEALLPAPPAAVQLLELLLDQPPVATELLSLALAHWLREAASAGVRVPHRQLPGLLGTATRRETLRSVVRTSGGERLRWLAAHNPDWSWFHEPAAAGPGREEGAPAAQPGVAAWRKLPLEERRRHLALLATPPGPAQEQLLEAALDDRAASVRGDAQRLLNAAPQSARAGRMAARLRPLLRTTGRIRTSLEVALPPDPDEAAVRDGLGKAPSGSQRAHWLAQIAAGAPLDVWTEATGRTPAETLAMIKEPAARAGILRAVVARKDAVWARAMVLQHPDLLHVLPEAERHTAALRLLRDSTSEAAVLAVIVQLPPPWSPAVSAAVVDRLQRRKQAVPYAPHLVPALAAGLHPGSVPQLQRWERSDHAWHDVPAALVRYLTLLPAITEAFR